MNTTNQRQTMLAPASSVQFFVTGARQPWSGGVLPAVAGSYFQCAHPSLKEGDMFAFNGSLYKILRNELTGDSYVFEAVVLSIDISEVWTWFTSHFGVQRPTIIGPAYTEHDIGRLPGQVIDLDYGPPARQAIACSVAAEANFFAAVTYMLLANESDDVIALAAAEVEAWEAVHA